MGYKFVTQNVYVVLNNLNEQALPSKFENCRCNQRLGSVSLDAVGWLPICPYICYYSSTQQSARFKPHAFVFILMGFCSVRLMATQPHNWVANSYLNSHFI